MTTDLNAATVSRLRLCVVRMSRRVRQLAGGGITPSQHSALSTIGRWGPLRLGALAERERISSSTVTRIVAALEERGHIERVPNPTDGRSSQVTLTDAGARQLASSRERADAYLARQMEGLSGEEREVLARAVPVLERLLEVRA